MPSLPDFKLETYFSKWEFNVKYNMCASDMESIPMQELLSMATDEDKKAWQNLHLGYTETYGLPKLRQAIANTYNSLKSNHILTFAGAEEGIYIAMKCILNNKDHAIVINPNYQSSETLPDSICDISGVSLDPKNDWNLDINEIESAIKSNTKLISINFPNNPTGKLISRKKLNDLIILAKKNDIYIFSDEIYRLMERDESKRLPQISDIYEKGLSLNAMSKSYGMPGSRIGWIASKDENLLSKMERMKHYLSICNSAPSEVLSLIALNQKEKILERTRRILKDNLKLLNNFFSDNSHLFQWKEPDGGCIGYPKYLGDDGVESFTKNLIKQEGVLLLPSSIYKSNFGPSTENHFRISYGRINMPKALDRLKRFIEK